MSGEVERDGKEKSAKDRELRLFRLTWPIFLEMLLFMLMGSVDTLMLSGVSDDAVSAVGVANQYVFIAILIIGVISNGAAIVVAQYLGARSRAEAARVSALSVTMNLGAGVVLSAVFLLFGEAILVAMNLQGQILAYASSYLRIVGGMLFFQAVINALSSIIRTYGYSKETMYVSLGMNVVHIIGNYALIFGALGLPEMGVTGAAVSTVVSRAAAVVVFAWLLYRLIDVRIALRDYVTFTRTYVRQIFRIGVPTAVEQVTYHICQSVFLYYVTFLGAEALASRQYAMNVSMYVFLFSAAVGTGTAIVVGRLVGAGRQAEAYGRVWSSVRWSLLATVAVDVLAIAFREPLVRLFTDDPDIVRMTTEVILYSLVLETGRAMNLVLINSLRAAGDAKYPVYVGFASMVGMSLPLGYVLVFVLDLGLAGVWLAIAADEWMRGVVMFFRWRSRVWERKALVGSRAAARPAAASG